jgi:hypothetical protein
MLQLANAADTYKQNQNQTQQIHQNVSSIEVNFNYSEKAKLLFGDSTTWVTGTGSTDQLSQTQRRQFNQQQALKFKMNLFINSIDLIIF